MACCTCETLDNALLDLLVKNRKAYSAHFFALDAIVLARGDPLQAGAAREAQAAAGAARAARRRVAARVADLSALRHCEHNGRPGSFYTGLLTTQGAAHSANALLEDAELHS